MTADRLTQFTNGPYTFDVIDSGPLDGIPVVLLHGWPQRASSWSGVAEHLHAAGLRTYAPDQRGYSPGARPDSRFAYGIADLTDDIVALITAIGGPVHLVGHDWGATIAWSVAGHHPELISSLTAVSVPHFEAFKRSMVTSRQALKSYYIGLFQLPFLPERVLAGKAGARLLRNSGMTREMIQRYQTEIVDYGALRSSLGYYRSAVRGMGTSPKVSVPTTYVWSDGDVALGRKGAELTEQWVTGPYEFEIFEGASHWIPEQRPAELAASIVKRVGARPLR